MRRQEGRCLLIHETVRYRELGLDERLRAEDQFLAQGEGEWQLISRDSIGDTPRRTAAIGTRWRRPYFVGDDEYVEQAIASERGIGDMSA